MKNSIHFIRLTFLLLLVVFSCNNDGQDKQDTQKESEPAETVQGLGRVGALNEISGITSEVNGIVQSKISAEGDFLNKGDTILILKHQDIATKARQLEAETEAAKLDIRITRQAIETAEKTLQSKKAYYHRIRKSFEDGSKSRQEVDDAELQFHQAEGNLNELRLRKTRQEKTLESIKKQREQNLIRLKKHFITAQGKGIILDLDIAKNDAVKALQPVGSFRYAGPLSADAEIDELYAALVKTGQKAYLIPYGLTDTVATGTLTSVSPQLAQKSLFSESANGFMDRRVRKIEIRIDTAYREIMVGQRIKVLIQTR